MANQIEIDIVARDMASGVLGAITSKMGALGGVLQGLATGNWAGAVSSGITAIADATEKAIGATVDYAGKITDLSRVTGLSAKESSSLIQVTEELGVSFDTITKAAANAIQDGILPTIDTLKQMAAEYQQLPNAMERASYATKAFGSSAKEMQKVLEATPAAIDDIIASAENLNLIWGDEQVSKVNNFIQVQNELKDVQESLKLSFGTVAMEAWYHVLLGLNVLVNGYTEGVKDACDVSYLFSKAADDVAKNMKSALSMTGAFTKENQSYADSLAELIEQRDLETAALKKAEAGYWAYDEAGSQVAQDLQNVQRELRQYRPALDLTGEKLEDLRAKEKALKDELGDYETTWGVNSTAVKEHKDAIEELETKINELKTAHEIATKTIVLGYMEQQLAIDGLDEKETAFLLSTGAKWGIYSEQAIQQMELVQSAWDALQLTDKEVNYFFNIKYSYTGELITPQFNPHGYNASEEMDEYGAEGIVDGPGGANGLDFIVPPGYSNDSYPIRAESGEHVQITPANRIQQGGGVEIDYDRFARIIAQELQKVSR